MTACYWDASAVLSALFRDDHSDQAIEWAKSDAVHLMSSLCFAEVNAVVARLHRERDLSEILIEAAREALSTGPWRRLNLSPEWPLVESLSQRWPLGGADLWHLATAKSLARELGDVSLLSFDTRLKIAVDGEGL